MKRTSINNRLRVYVAVWALLTALTSAASDFSDAQLAFLRSVTSSYSPWQRVELSGKLHYEKLPINPSLKIYMERGALLYISVRAPFMGEAGRLEIDQNYITIVDKMHKRFVREDLSALKALNIPITLSDIQDLLLARAFIADYGTLSPQNQELCSIYQEPDCWLLVPLAQPSGDSVRYGYTFDFDCKLQDLYVTTISENYAALVQYAYHNKKYSLDFNIQLSSKQYEASLQFDAPKWNPDKALSSIAINRDWKQVDIRTFLRIL